MEAVFEELQKITAEYEHSWEVRFALADLFNIRLVSLKQLPRVLAALTPEQRYQLDVEVFRNEASNRGIQLRRCTEQYYKN